ncbi:hypothetical protein V1520DRAFT_337008 [Lipomyces starkeyi]|uniref:Myb-like domain-containing protein n=1 Tax=Lipomyces starkeyi NRRL Y-11557 TaxID=675824 RepID=A0A1E3QFH9_LIPST|nr:hypothetical protein LIPSTDRAFT_317 [Lipomyces starkeyi NRRL Y-11557]
MDEDESELLHSFYSLANNDLPATQVIPDSQDATVNENETQEEASQPEKKVALPRENPNELDDCDAATVASIDLTSEWNYNVNYLALLNYEIEEFMNPVSHFQRMITEHDHNHLTSYDPRHSRLLRESAAIYPLKSSIVESRTHWSPEEKELFFEYLGRRSRHDPVGISRGVGTKTPVECAEYIAVLEHGLHIVRAKEQRRRLPGMRLRWKRLMRKIPAARKMSRQWIRFEESESRRLENFRESRDRNKEAKAWLRSHAAVGDQRSQLAIEIDSEESGVSSDEVKRISGLVDNYCADLVERENRAYPDDVYFDRIGEKFSRECQLLNIEKMLDLSSRLYYQRENLSSSVTEYLHRHAFQFSTISLFHGLVRQFTRRLVATTLAVAETRLRVSRNRAFHRKQVVQREDVQTACAVVGAEVNADRFWIGFKRRNEALRITEPGSRGIREIDADTVAELLSIRIKRRR